MSGWSALLAGLLPMVLLGLVIVQGRPPPGAGTRWRGCNMPGWMFDRTWTTPSGGVGPSWQFDKPCLEVVQARDQVATVLDVRSVNLARTDAPFSWPGHGIKLG